VSETWVARIVEALRLSRLPLDDDELARRLGASQRQTVNQACRRLEALGVIERYVGRDGKIVNHLLETDAGESTTSTREAAAAPLPVTRPAKRLITEDEVKAAVKSRLETDGWIVKVARGRERGIDIQATRGDETLIVEAKGETANPPQQVNYFLAALGELIQRMTIVTATYGLALPDNRQYRGLVQRLPELARERLNLAIFYVDGEGTVARE
jgi:hypothetical protein